MPSDVMGYEVSFSTSMPGHIDEGVTEAVKVRKRRRGPRALQPPHRKLATTYPAAYSQPVAARQRPGLATWKNWNAVLAITLVSALR